MWNRFLCVYFLRHFKHNIFKSMDNRYLSSLSSQFSLPTISLLICITHPINYNHFNIKPLLCAPQELCIRCTLVKKKRKKVSRHICHRRALRCTNSDTLAAFLFHRSHSLRFYTSCWRRNFLPCYLLDLSAYICYFCRIYRHIFYIISWCYLLSLSNWVENFICDLLLFLFFLFPRDGFFYNLHITPKFNSE